MAGLYNQAWLYTTLTYNLARNLVTPNKYAWYTRIDDTVILGALPFKSMAPQLIQKEKVGGVVNMTEAYETDPDFVLGENEFKAFDCEYLALPTVDFTGCPSLLQVKEAVDFCRSFEGTGRSVYVHCKAGRARSALIVSAYLIDKNNWHNNVAYDHVRRLRPQVLLHAKLWVTLQDFDRRYRRPKTPSPSGGEQQSR